VKEVVGGGGGGGGGGDDGESFEAGHFQVYRHCVLVCVRSFIRVEARKKRRTNDQ